MGRKKTSWTGVRTFQYDRFSEVRDIGTIHLTLSIEFDDRATHEDGVKVYNQAATQAINLLHALGVRVRRIPRSVPVKKKAKK